MQRCRPSIGVQAQARSSRNGRWQGSPPELLLLRRRRQRLRRSSANLALRWNGSLSWASAGPYSQGVAWIHGVHAKPAFLEGRLSYSRDCPRERAILQE